MNAGRSDDKRVKHKWYSIGISILPTVCCMRISLIPWYFKGFRNDAIIFSAKLCIKNLPFKNVYDTFCIGKTCWSKILWELCEFHNSFMQKFLMLQFIKLANPWFCFYSNTKIIHFQTQERKLFCHQLNWSSALFSFASCDWLY